MKAWEATELIVITSDGMILETIVVSIEDEEVFLVDGGLEGALGALGDESLSLGDGVFVSSMMLIFGLLEALEMEALVDAMMLIMVDE
ncbi:hypothetical protein Tco_1074540 [Tanacetum coccineum]